MAENKIKTQEAAEAELKQQLEKKKKASAVTTQTLKQITKTVDEQ